MVGVATVAGNVADSRSWEEQARRQGVPQEQINDWRKKASEAPDRAKDAARDPENQQAAADAAAKASWWAFGGALLSMLASAAGALIGSGPSLRLVHIRRTPTLGTTRG